jgi:hypothetical protein
MGIIRPAVASQGRGGMDAAWERKNANMMFAFFYLAATGHGSVVPLFFEHLMKAFFWSGAEEKKPSIKNYREVSPAAKGGQYRSALGLPPK